MSSLITRCNLSTKRPSAVLPIMLLVVLAMIAQTLSQSVMASNVPSQQTDEVADHASHTHEHNHSADHHASASDVDDSEATQAHVAHHTGHDHDDGCCQLVLCGGACSSVCSGSYVGDPSATTTPFKPTLICVTVRDAIDDSLLARPPGVPFRPPIHG